MKRTILFLLPFLLLFVLLASLPMHAQDPAPTVTIRVKYGLLEKLWNILLRPRTTIVGFTCDKTELEPGEITACTVTISAPARAGGLRVDVIVPVELTGPSVVTINQGATSVTFSISRPSTTGAVVPDARRILTSGYRVYAWYTERAQYFAVVM